MEDIVGTLIVGAALVMLHPKGMMDFDYLAEVLKTKYITFMHAVPTLVHSLFDYLIENRHVSAVASLRSLCSIGEPFPIIIKLVMICFYSLFFR
jgi:non-ribosomal peptide synthetase component F